MYDNLKIALIKEYKKFADAGNSFPEEGLISVRDKESNCIALKSNKVGVRNITVEDIIIVDANGKVIEGEAETLDNRFRMHKVLYDACEDIMAVAQPESRWNSIWAQCAETLPPVSFMHAENFFGEIQCTASVTFSPNEDPYENMGKGILSSLHYKGVKSDGAIFIRNGSGIVWGKELSRTVDKAVALEEICFRTWHVRAVNKSCHSYVSYEMNELLYK